MMSVKTSEALKSSDSTQTLSRVADDSNDSNADFEVKSAGPCGKIMDNRRGRL